MVDGMLDMKSPPGKNRVVIVGGGFGGLYAARELAGAGAEITIIDRRNFHLFQPLLYQVATGGLSPGDIASPLRAVFSRRKDVRVITGEVTDFDPRQRKVYHTGGELEYDSLIFAAGSAHHYFGHDDWAGKAPGLKSVEDALEIRSRILSAFEEAEKDADHAEQAGWLRFVIVGGGPTGVELAGALAELCRYTMKNDFREIDPTKAEIIIVESGSKILAAYPERLRRSAVNKLRKLGCEVRINSQVVDIDQGNVTIRSGDSEEKVPARTVLWAAGVEASGLSRVIAERTGARKDKNGRIMVAPDLSIPGYDNIYIIGDLACFKDRQSKPLPGMAAVAMQQGKYVARLIKGRLKGNPEERPFRYRNRGMLAVIGRDAAVADLGRLKLSGFVGWLVWVFIHIAYLIEFDNKLMVLIQWAGDYLTRKRGARLITGKPAEGDLGRKRDEQRLVEKG